MDLIDFASNFKFLDGIIDRLTVTENLLWGWKTALVIRYKKLQKYAGKIDRAKFNPIKNERKYLNEKNMSFREAHLYSCYSGSQRFDSGSANKNDDSVTLSVTVAAKLFLTGIVLFHRSQKFQLSTLQINQSLKTLFLEALFCKLNKNVFVFTYHILCCLPAVAGSESSAPSSKNFWFEASYYSFECNLNSTFSWCF